MKTKRKIYVQDLTQSNKIKDQGEALQNQGLILQRKVSPDLQGIVQLVNADLRMTARRRICIHQVWSYKIPRNLEIKIHPIQVDPAQGRVEKAASMEERKMEVKEAMFTQMVILNQKAPSVMSSTKKSTQKMSRSLPNGSQRKMLYAHEHLEECFALKILIKLIGTHPSIGYLGII